MRAHKGGTDRRGRRGGWVSSGLAHEITPFRAPSLLTAPIMECEREGGGQGQNIIFSFGQIIMLVFSVFSYFINEYASERSFKHWGADQEFTTQHCCRVPRSCRYSSFHAGERKGRRADDINVGWADGWENGCGSRMGKLPLIVRAQWPVRQTSCSLD